MGTRSLPKTTPATARGRITAAVDKGLRQIDRDLRLCRATLQCAATALGYVEGENFESGSARELAASAIRVVERCSGELVRIEDSLDRLSIEAHSS